MPSLSELHHRKVFVDLRHLADFVKVAGISSVFPKEPDGKVSLAFALAMLCGAKQSGASDDFQDLLEAVPGPYVPRFILCWDAIELEVQQDIVEWSRTVSETEVIDRLRSMSAEIEHSQIL